MLRDEDVAARRPVPAGGMQDARVRRALQHDAERTGADRARDVAHELRAIARRHEDGRVFGDGVLESETAPGQRS